MIAREGRDEVVDREAHDCRMEEGEEEGEEERVKYQARIDLQLKGIKGVRPNGHMVSSLPARDPRSAPVPSASTPAFRRFTPIMLSSMSVDSPARYSGQLDRQRRVFLRGNVQPSHPGVCPFTASCPRALRTLQRQSLHGKIDPARPG